MSVNNPTLKVEIAFTSDPLDTTPTWVNVSQYVRRTPGLSLTRGKGERAEAYDAGHLQLTLSNRDRRFDPSYAAGPNFGNLIPRKQIRITATWASVDYIMFTGWVTGWPQGFTDVGKDAMVTIEAISAEAWLANNNLPDDLVYDYANTTLGNLIMFLRGADTSQWSDATNGGHFANLIVGTGRTSSSLVPGMSSTAVVFDGLTTWRFPQYTTSGAWSLSMWIQTSQPDGTLISGLDPSGFTTYSAVSVSAGLVSVSFDVSGTGPYGFDSGAVTINDGFAHHIMVTADGATLAGYHLYIDAVDVTANRVGSGAESLIIDWIGVFWNGNDPYTGSIQDLAVWDQQLTPAEVVGFTQRSFGFLEESSADRATRILDDVGWPAAWREITTTERALVGELVYDGAPALSKLQEVERSEQGMLFATKAGNIAFRERYYADEVTVGNTVQQIFSDDGGATALPFSTFEFQFNDVDVTNAASVTTPTTRAASSDATSITVNGLQSRQVDTILSTFAQANSMAEGLVAQGKDAAYRAAPILVYPAKNTTRWDEVLTLELGYRVSMEITPMKLGTQNAQEVTLERLEWLIEDDLWSLIVAGSPCFGSTAGSAGWFIWGSSLVNGPDLIGY